MGRAACYIIKLFYKVIGMFKKEERSLREMRCDFSLSLAKLIIYANECGYEVAIDSVKVCRTCKTHAEFSLHKEGLAADLNLYKDGVWLSDGSGHDILHLFWDNLGGSKVIKGDSNHYSYAYHGRR